MNHWQPSTAEGRKAVLLRACGLSFVAAYYRIFGRRPRYG